jgi:hypothetical protein
MESMITGPENGLRMTRVTVVTADGRPDIAPEITKARRVMQQRVEAAAASAA